MRRIASYLIGLLSGFLMLMSSAGAAPSSAGLQLEEGFAPTQDLTVWPLQIVQGYPLLRAQVGQVQGVLMLDTGTPWGLLLNSARLPMPERSFVLRASAGSGQAFDVYRASTMPALSIHGQTWTQIKGVHTADLAFIEQGTAIGTFLGFVGANFLKDAALTLDYARRVALITRLAPDSGAPLAEPPADLRPAAALAVLHYRATQASFPVFDATLGGLPVRVMLDTGNPGAALDSAWLAELKQAGAATGFSTLEAGRTYRLPPLQLGSFSVPVEDATGYATPVTLDGQIDRQLLKIGYSLLKRVGVVWNYRLQTMTFFTP